MSQYVEKKSYRFLFCFFFWFFFYTLIESDNIGLPIRPGLSALAFVTMRILKVLAKKMILKIIFVGRTSSIVFIKLQIWIQY